MNQKDRLASYTASSIFPVKLLHNDEIIDEGGRILPFHIQVCPTNLCDLNCSFCSCANRNSGLTIPWQDMQNMLIMFSELGTRAISVTGGGEPLLYPELNALIDLAESLQIKVGLVTNGIAIENLKAKRISWIRVSVSDTRQLNTGFFEGLKRAIERIPNADWSFSYVLTKYPQYEKLKKILAFAEENHFGHVRIVSDLMDLDHTPEMEDVRSVLDGISGESLALYQGRKEYDAGQQRCLVSLLKPTIAADGNVYPCCGVQYALQNPSRDFEPSMSMGHWSEFRDIMSAQRHFDGSRCVRCYYKFYNEALAMLTAKVKHKEHI